MPLIRVPGAGAVGVNKDLSQHELPNNAWTSALNIRFLDGLAYQFFGHGQVYDDPLGTPQFVQPCNIAGERYWIYACAGKVYCVTITDGAAVHTDISPLTARAGTPNAWTAGLLSGLPVLNAGDGKPPMVWDLKTTGRFIDLPNWPAGVSCKSMRSFRNFLVALGITKPGGSYPYMVKWSQPADPGSVPTSWDAADATMDSGETDLAEGYDPIVDGLQLRDTFMIYKESSCWRMDFTGGPYVFRFSKVLGTSGALNRNCIAEIDGFHVVLTGSDVIVHDGTTATSVLDKQTRRYLFQNIDVNGVGLCFVFKNPFFNEVFVCYPSIGSASCDMAMVWNYVDKTVSFRQVPALNHAAFGMVDKGLQGNWAQDPAPWSSDRTVWDAPDLVPTTARVIMASSLGKLHMLDSSTSFDGAIPQAHIERRGLSFGEPESMKLVRGVRPRIMGSPGETVLIRVGGQTDPWAEPEWGPIMPHVIGQQVANDCFVSGRYIALRLETGTAYEWRLDSFDLDVEPAGWW